MVTARSLIVVVALGAGCRGGGGAPGEVGFAAHTPKVGDAAPDFSLSRLGGGTVSRDDLCGPTPAVLIFGSYS